MQNAPSTDPASSAEAPPDPGAAPNDIRSATLGGVRSIASGRLLAEVSTFASSVILARLIAPADFGAAVLAIFLYTLAAGVRDQALTWPLVQRKEATREHLET